jgi:FKBP-type peptidyl-prolyl cis-trans isomerase
VIKDILMKKLIGIMVLVFSASCTFAATPKTEEEKTLYVLGQLLARQIAPFELKKDELQMVMTGFSDGASNAKPQVKMEEYGPKVNEWVQKRSTAIAAAEKKKGDDFLAKIAKESGVKKAPSGFFYKIEKEGTGEKPKATDRVKVHYHGTLIDGTVFDSSVERKEPATFALDRVIPCWTQGVQELKVGGKMKLYCPSDLAYGERGSPPTIKGGAALIFDVELLGIEKETPKPAAPASPAKTPAKK